MSAGVQISNICYTYIEADEAQDNPAPDSL
jgi:hypothetical protein